MFMMQKQSEATEHRFQQLEQLVQRAASGIRPTLTSTVDSPLALVLSSSQPRAPDLMDGQHQTHFSTSHPRDFLAESEALESFKVTAMAGWPEMQLEEVGHADKFKPWRQKYSEYISKCTDKQRTPATMAQAFSKWASWFATAFSEQDRQRHEQAGEYASAFTSPVLSAVDVLMMPDDEFIRRYLAFCQVKIKDPSQVLQLLSTPKVDASSGDLVQLMQAAQSFTEQLQLIPKAALQQCSHSQIREAFISSIFGVDQLRERKVDYLKCGTWHDACQLMIRKASGAGGTAFTPFKPLKDLPAKTKGEKDKDHVKEKSDSAKEKPVKGSDDDRAPNMSLKTEVKWKTRFTELAEEHGIRHPRHSFAPSWKTRYAYLLDCIKQHSKCNRCRRRGHLPSVCPEPLPEVSYPDLSEDQLQFLKGRRLTQYDEEGNVFQTHQEKGGQVKQTDNHQSSSTPVSSAPEQRLRGSSRERITQQQGSSASAPSSQECYRCGREGHRASECKAETHRDGKHLQPRSERSQSPSNRAR